MKFISKISQKNFNYLWITLLHVSWFHGFDMTGALREWRTDKLTQGKLRLGRLGSWWRRLSNLASQYVYHIKLNKEGGVTACRWNKEVGFMEYRWVEETVLAYFARSILCKGTLNLQAIDWSGKGRKLGGHFLLHMQATSAHGPKEDFGILPSLTKWGSLYSLPMSLRL